MKLSVLVVILMVLQVSLMLFYTTVSTEDTSAIPAVYNGSNVSLNYTGTGGNITTAKFYQFIADPTQWTSSAFMIGLIAFIVVMAATGIRLFGSTLVSSDTVRFAGIFLILFGLGSVPIIGLWGLISNEITAIACKPGVISCFTSWMAAFLITMPLTVMWFLACLTHWRTGSSTT